MNKFVRPTEVGNRSANSRKSGKRRSGIMLLEPRVMYDGAAAASAGHHHHHDHADGSPNTGAPAQGTPPIAELATPPNGANPNGHNYGSRPGDWSTSTSSVDHGGSHHGQNVVFVDSSIADYQAIVAAINPGTNRSRNPKWKTRDGCSLRTVSCPRPKPASRSMAADAGYRPGNGFMRWHRGGPAI
jgi:hypothetical protein